MPNPSYAIRETRPFPLPSAMPGAPYYIPIDELLLQGKSIMHQHKKNNERRGGYMEWFCSKRGVQRTSYLPRLACRFKMLWYTTVPIIPKAIRTRKTSSSAHVAWRHGKARQGRARQDKAGQGIAWQAKPSQAKPSQGRTRHCMALHGKARQGKARQGKARQARARQARARQAKPREGKTSQGKARHCKMTQAKTRQGETRQDKARQGKTRQEKAGRRTGSKRREGGLLEHIRDNSRKRDRNRA